MLTFGAMGMGEHLGGFYVPVFECGRGIYHPKPGQRYLVYPLGIVRPIEKNEISPLIV